MMVSAMIINNAFMFPFVIAGFGDGGFADAVLFDFGNGVITATVAYMIAFKYGAEKSSTRTLAVKLVKSPLSWALGLAVPMSWFSIFLPDVVENFLSPIGDMTAPLILISLGIFFAPKVADLRLALVTLVIRMGLGLLVGAAMAAALGLQGTTFSVGIDLFGRTRRFQHPHVRFTGPAGSGLRVQRPVPVHPWVGIVYIPILMVLFR